MNQMQPIALRYICTRSIKKTFTHEKKKNPARKTKYQSHQPRRNVSSVHVLVQHTRKPPRLPPTPTLRENQGRKFDGIDGF